MKENQPEKSCACSELIDFLLGKAQITRSDLIHLCKRAGKNSDTFLKVYDDRNEVFGEWVKKNASEDLTNAWAAREGYRELFKRDYANIQIREISAAMPGFRYIEPEFLTKFMDEDMVPGWAIDQIWGLLDLELEDFTSDIKVINPGFEDEKEFWIIAEIPMPFFGESTFVGKKLESIVKSKP